MTFVNQHPTLPFLDLLSPQIRPNVMKVGRQWWWMAVMWWRGGFKLMYHYLFSPHILTAVDPEPPSHTPYWNGHIRRNVYADKYQRRVAIYQRFRGVGAQGGIIHVSLQLIPPYFFFLSFLLFPARWFADGAKVLNPSSSIIHLGPDSCGSSS